MAEGEKDYGYAADLLWAELRRVWPEDMPKEELLRSSGLETEEARQGLKVLEEQGRLDPDADLLKAKVTGEEDAPGPEEEAETAETPAASDVPPASTTAPLVASSGGKNYHSHFALMVAYGGTPGSDEGAAVKTARAMETEIADRLGQMYGGSVVSVELLKMEVYDKPREIPLAGGGD